MKKFVSILADLRKSHEKDSTIPAFIEYVRGETGFSVVPPEVGEDLANEKFEWGIFANGWIVFDDATQTVTEVMSLIPYESINVASPTRSVRDLGEFTVKSGAIRFTDPCYDNDTWCKGSMPAANGQYQARIGFFRDSYDEGDLLELIAVKKMAIEILEPMTEYSEYEKFIKMNKAIKAYEKANGRSIYTSWKSIGYPADVTPIVEALVPKFAPLNIHKSWWKDEEYAQNCLEKLVNYVLVEKYSHILDRARSSDGHHLTMALMRMRVPEGTANEAHDQVWFAMSNPVCVEALKKSVEYTQQLFDSGKPQRTHFLHIKHESVPEFTAFDQDVWIENDKFDVGVDSGQAGFFDEGWYQNEYGGDTDRDDRKAYFELCALSSGGDSYRNADNPDKEEGGTFEHGCNSHTAHGDGSAPLYYRINNKGEVIEAVYHYDATCEDEEEDEEEGEEVTC